jgi:biopolymer transport protein ExbB
MILTTVTNIFEILILLSLAGLSIWSIAIIIDRKNVFKKENRINYKELQNLIEQKNWDKARIWCAENPGFVSGSLAAALLSATPASIDRSVASFAKLDRMRLEQGFAVLATLGANAPFIGLFGTVLGIIRSFAYLGSQSGSGAVMSGVSQALYATAIGLFVAVPAVVSYNIFSKKMRDLLFHTESLRDLYVSKLQG